MAISSRGKVNAQLTQNRRVISVNSSLGSSSAVNVRGSSAIPQIGQAAGPRVTISGCIGHVYSPLLPQRGAAARSERQER